MASGGELFWPQLRRVGSGGDSLLIEVQELVP